MALKTSNSPRGMSLASFGQGVTRRREILGDIAMPRNSGLRRTDSKIALLAAIENVGGSW